MKWGFGILGIGCMFFALFGIHEEYYTKTLWVLDTSLSMSALDIVREKNLLSSRIDVAKSIILSGSLALDGEAALATFGEDFRLQLPFSSDRDTFHAILSAIEPRIYDGGTDIASAFQGIELIYPHEKMHIIFLTDGEGFSSGSTFSQFDNTTAIDIVGIGTPGGAPMLQGYDADGKPRYKQYAGANALTKRDDVYLKELTKKYHANLHLIENWNEVKDAITSLQVNPYREMKYSDYLLSLGVILLIASLLMRPYSLKKES